MPKWNNLPSQWGAVLHWNFIGKRALVGCNCFFHFGSENWEEQVKNTLYKIYQVAQFFLTVKWKSSFSFVLSKLNLHPLINNIENFGQRFSDLFVTVFNILVPVYLKNSVKKASSVLIFFRWGLFFTQSLKILTMAILVMKCLAYNLSKISWEITWVCIQIILWWFTFFFEHRRKFTQCIFFPWRSCSLFSFKSFVVNLRVAISAASLTSSSPNSALATLRLCIMNQGIHIIRILYCTLYIMRKSLWRNAYFTLYFLQCTLYLSFSMRVILILWSWKGSKFAGTEQYKTRIRRLRLNYIVWLKSESVGSEIVQPFHAFLFGYNKSRKKLF